MEQKFTASLPLGENSQAATANANRGQAWVPWLLWLYIFSFVTEAGKYWPIPLAAEYQTELKYHSEPSSKRF